MKPNVLFLADPQSYTHDYKWLIGLCDFVNCYVIPQNHQYKNLNNCEIIELQKRNIKILQPIRPFSVLRFYNTIIDLYYILKQINKYNIQILHIHYAEPLALWAVFKSIINKPILLTSRGTDVLKAIPIVFTKNTILSFILRILYKISFSQIDQITSTSLSQKETIEKYFNLKGNIEIVRTGVDFGISKIEHIRNPIINKLKEKKYWLFPRTMKSLYNHELSLTTLGILPEHITKNRLFIFIDRNSKDTEYVNMIEAMMQKHENLDFLFLNLVDHKDMIMLIENAELIINTNKSDGSSVTVMEAMRLKKKIILPPLEYDEEIFGGVLKFKEFTPNALSQAIYKILNGHYTSDILKHNYNIVTSNCDRRNEMKKVRNLYFNFIQNRNY